MQPSFTDIVLGPGEGTTLSTMGAQISLKAVSNDTNGRFTVLEYAAPPGFTGPISHSHKRTIEVLYVLEGELTVKLAGNRHTAVAGSFIYVPKDVLHGFSNDSDSPTRFLSILSPGGMERYFQEVSETVEKHGYPLPPEIMAELGSKYDIETPPPSGQ